MSITIVQVLIPGKMWRQSMIIQDSLLIFLENSVQKLH